MARAEGYMFGPVIKVQLRAD